MPNNMSEFTDVSELGYQVERELGQNRAGGRVTYLASTNTQQPVVLKQFQFAQSGSSWSGYDAYHQEIKLLQQLNHPSIPQYLDSFETTSGFCIVQEYKQAPSLAQQSHFTPQEIKQIAIAVLEVLVYLQQQNPPVIHRDIKPENILVERQEQLKVTLVDFGFARMGGGEVAMSSVVKGTLGFMPPEQLFNRQLTEASDLYSLGATLICLLTDTKSSAVGDLIDETYRINFKHLVPHLSPQFVAWLSKMTAPSLKKRFNNAAAALEALKPIPVVCTVVPATSISATKIMTQFTIAMLATIGGFVLVISTMLVILNGKQPEYSSYQPDAPSSVDTGERLLANRECSYCDLRGENLRDAKLWGANLEGADLKGVNLENADLTNANLDGANLKGANLTSAKLTGAILANTNLKDAYLEEAALWNANLKKAYLESASLVGGKLGGANLEDAYLEAAKLKDANLEGANLKNAKMGGADLTGADLENADLTGVNLQGANLRDANLEGANLWGANLTNTNLSGANLKDAKLGGAYLRGAYLKGVDLSGATMPDGKIHP